MKKIIFYSLSSLFAAIVLLLLLVTSLVSTEGGSRWVLQRIPGLELSQFSGRLAGRFEVQNVLWEAPGKKVQLNQLVLDWSPSCLLHKALCIGELSIGNASLDFAENTEEQSTEPLQLPNLQLPIDIQINQLSIGPVNFNGNEQLQNLTLSAQWQDDRLHIDQIHVIRPDVSAQLQGYIQPIDNWPLHITGATSISLPDFPEQKITLDLSGNLLQTLTLAAQGTGLFNGELAATVEALNADLPVTLALSSAEFVPPVAGLPDTLRLQDLNITLDGNLAEGFAVKGLANFPAKEAPIQLNLLSYVTTEKATIQRFELRADSKHRVGLTGELSWLDTLKAEAELKWLDFPWQRLYPDVESPVKVEKLTLQASYDNGAYLGNVDGTFTGPAGPFSLITPFSGDLTSLNLPSLSLVAGQGKLGGSVNLDFADTIEWKAKLVAQDFNPAYWVKELPGRLGGEINSQGTVQGEKINAEGLIALRGQLRQQPTQLMLDANASGAEYQLKKLELIMGKNRVSGQGKLDKELTANLDIQLIALAQLWPGLAGSLTGDLKAQGPLDMPHGALNLQGNQLAFEANKLKQLSVQATLTAQGKAQLNADAQGVSTGDFNVGSVTLVASGIEQQHQAKLDLKGPDLVALLALNGGLNAKGDWLGRISQLQLAGYGQDWQLQAPTALNYLASGRLTLGEHCLRSGNASLCAPTQRLMPDPQIRYTLNQFALASLQPFLPDGTQWQGVLNGHVSLDLPAAGPKGDLFFESLNGSLSVVESGKPLSFNYSTLALSSTLTPSNVVAQLRFEGPELGQLRADMQIDPRREIKPIKGGFSIQGLNLSAFKPFVTQVDQLNGLVAGTGQISGTLQKPLVQGVIGLRDGYIGGGEMPLMLENLTVDVDVQGTSATLNGQWTSGKTGRGTLNGDAQWGSLVRMALNLEASNLPVTVEPYAEVIVTPKLMITLADERLSVSGNVSVPSGKITINELPPSTVNVSPDVVIVGQEQAEDSALQVAMDIDVNIGEDKLSFSGFGLKADVKGELHIGNNMDTRGELKLVNGRYRAYGQRLTIRRANILFAGLLSEPYLDVEAIRNVSDHNVIAGIRLNGSVTEPQATVFAEPSMSQEQALSYLVMGKPLGTDGGDNNLLAQAALGLGLMGTSSITSGIANAVGISDFQLDTEGSGDQTSVVATGKLTDKLAVRYGMGVFEPMGTFAIRYALTRSFFIEAASGVANSLDIFYRKDF